MTPAQVTLVESSMEHARFGFRELAARQAGPFPVPERATVK